MKIKCKEQKLFIVKKTDKLILIIDGDRGKNISHEMVRIDYTPQLRYFSKFLGKFISNKNKIKKIISGLKYDLHFAKTKPDHCSSFRVEDQLSNIDFCEYTESGILYLFMAVYHKKKPKEWRAEDYFKN